ncbi:MAG: DMT family transporter [Flavobacteriales bacterium]|nr:DMT family transporter [Flavobacteriales bacterium]
MLLLAALALIWGSSFILIKKAMFTDEMQAIFSSQQVAALRIFFAGLFLIPFGIGKLSSLNSRDWLLLSISGVVGTSIPAFLFTEAQQHIDSALAGMLNALTPLFTFIMGVVVFGVAFRKNGLVGVMIGLLGALGLIYFRSEGPIALNVYALLVVIATLCYGTNINVIKTYLSHMPSLVISSISLMIVMPVAGVYALMIDSQSVVLEHDQGPLALLYIIILALFSTSLGLILFNMLIKKVSALFASSVTYFIPIAAIGWGILDGEKVSLIQIAFIALILLGVWYVNRRKRA